MRAPPSGRTLTPVVVIISLALADFFVRPGFEYMTAEAFGITAEQAALVAAVPFLVVLLGLTALALWDDPKLRGHP